MRDYMDVIHFWFDQTSKIHWWQQNNGFDQLIEERFSSLYQQACRCELYQWRQTAHGRLAEIILLDQFSRNLFRDSVRAYDQDSLALALAQEAVAAGADQALSVEQRGFIYLPYMHSESLPMHVISLELYNQAGLEMSVKSAQQHHELIQRFGRYPHRNTLFGRTSTAEEVAFLERNGRGF